MSTTRTPPLIPHPAASISPTTVVTGVRPVHQTSGRRTSVVRCRIRSSGASEPLADGQPPVDTSPQPTPLRSARPFSARYSHEIGGGRRHLLIDTKPSSVNYQAERVGCHGSRWSRSSTRISQRESVDTNRCVATDRGRFARIATPPSVAQSPSFRPLQNGRCSTVVARALARSVIVTSIVASEPNTSARTLPALHRILGETPWPHRPTTTHASINTCR